MLNYAWGVSESMAEAYYLLEILIYLIYLVAVVVWLSWAETELKQLNKKKKKLYVSEEASRLYYTLARSIGDYFELSNLNNEATILLQIGG